MSIGTTADTDSSNSNILGGAGVCFILSRAIGAGNRGSNFTDWEAISNAGVGFNKTYLPQRMSQDGSVKQQSATAGEPVVVGKPDKDLSRSYGTNWNSTTVSTLFEWICIASYKIACLEFASNNNRKQIQNITIIGLILATLSGTISIGTFSIPGDSGLTQKILSGVFTLLSFTIAVATGYLKVYQVQERLEQYIKLKQDWVIFSTSVASELQLPIELRKDGLWVIIKNKTTYLDLLKIDVEIPEFCHMAARAHLSRIRELNLDVSSLSNIILDIGFQELNDIQKNPLGKEQLNRIVGNIAINAAKMQEKESKTRSEDGRLSALVEGVLNKHKFAVNALADNSNYNAAHSLTPPSPGQITLIIKEDPVPEETTLPPKPPV